MSNARKTQTERMRAFFEARPNVWIPLPEILALGMAQFGARILELRREGMNIENRMETVGDARHSWYRYTPRAKQQTLFQDVA